MTTTATPVVEPLSGPTGRLVAAHRGELREVLRRHGVTNARLFGSVARGEDHDGSDVDWAAVVISDSGFDGFPYAAGTGWV